MLENLKTARLSDNAYCIGFRTPHGMLTQNVYLVRQADGFCLIEAGIRHWAEQLVQELKTLCPVDSLRAILLLDNSQYAVSALECWRQAGFRGEIVADWRTALELNNGGLVGPFRYIHSAEDRPVAYGELQLRASRARPGFLYACLVSEGLLFSGAYGSALGRELPAAVPGSGPAQQAFRAYMGEADPDAGALLEAFGLPSARLCPRFGPLLESGTVAGKAAPAEPAALGSDYLLEEIQKLEAEKFDLQSAMVLASDSALRDPLSGLYGRQYAEEFLGSLLAQGAHFAAGFMMIDRIRQYNRDAGVAAGDELIASMAAFLQEQGGQLYLFRWSGPVFLLIGETDREQAARRFEALREAVEAERRFARPLTVSVALVGSDELAVTDNSKALAELQSLARARLKLLERRGGNQVLSDSDADVQEKTLALILDGNPVSAKLLVEYLERQDFHAVGLNQGAEALGFMDRYQPEVVVAALNVPQYDAFQIRAHMLESGDLRHIPMVLLVEAKTGALVERAHGLRIFHIIEKPVMLRELFGLLRYLTKWSDNAG